MIKFIKNLFKRRKQLNISDVIMSRKCKKSLYKSTYKGNAFTKNKTYNVVDEDDNFFYIIDNEGQEFSMCKAQSNVYYWIDDYFYSL
jgi:hypothetical protein